MPTAPKDMGVADRYPGAREQLAFHSLGLSSVHSCCSRSVRGLPAFTVVGGSAPAWWAAHQASFFLLAPSTAVPPVPVSES
jgi:hypothetical protein